MSSDRSWPTADEVRSKRFSPRRHGVDPAEVTAYLQRVGDAVDEQESQARDLRELLLGAEHDRHTTEALRSALAASEARVAELESELARARSDADYQRGPDLPEDVTRGQAEALELFRHTSTSASRLRAAAQSHARRLVEDAAEVAEQLRAEQSGRAQLAETRLRAALEQICTEAEQRVDTAMADATRITVAATRAAQQTIDHAAREARRILGEPPAERPTPEDLPSDLLLDRAEELLYVAKDSGQSESERDAWERLHARLGRLREGLR